MIDKKQSRIDAYKRLKCLVLLQAGEKKRLSKTKETKYRLLGALLKVLAFVAVTGILYALMWFFKTQFRFTLNKTTLISIIFFTQVLSAFSVALTSSKLIFGQKENSMLLVYPCKHSEIFISKMIIYIGKEIKKNLFFLLPLLLSFAIVVKATVVYYFFILPIWFMLCLFPVFLGTAFSVVIANAKKFLKKHVLINTLLLIVAFIGLFFLVDYVINFIPRPIRLVAIYGKFIKGVSDFLQKATKFALFYNFVGNVLFNQNLFLNLIILVATLIGIIAFCCVAVMPFFFKTASSTAENSTKSKTRKSLGKPKSLFTTFLNKEFKLLFRSSDNLNGAISTVMVFPILIYVLNFILAGIVTNELGDFMTIAFNVMIITSLLSIYNSTAASAISSEGEGFTLLKIAPSNTMKVCYAKMLVICFVNLLAIIISSVVVFYVSKLKVIDLILMIATILLISTGNVMWNFELDVYSPKIGEYIVKGESYTDNPNISKAVFIGFIVSTFAGLLSLLLLFDGYITGWIRIILLAIAFIVIRLYLLSSNLKAYFRDIQM